jgi:DNA topoisomerase I
LGEGRRHLQLIDKTRLRVGNLEYERQNESFGLTTLKDDHVDIAGDRLTLAFRGKSGKEHSITVRDRRLARLVRQCQELPGQELFQYQDEDGTWRMLRSNDVNLYLRDVTGQDFTAKDFRTWGGTVAVAEALYATGPASSERERKRNVASAIRSAARLLGNTVAVCRKYYVHPAILAAYGAGTLTTAIEGAQVRPVAGLDPLETAVLELLRRHAAGLDGVCDARAAPSAPGASQC